MRTLWRPVICEVETIGDIHPQPSIQSILDSPWIAFSAAKADTCWASSQECSCWPSATQDLYNSLNPHINGSIKRERKIRFRAPRNGHFIEAVRHQSTGTTELDPAQAPYLLKPIRFCRTHQSIQQKRDTHSSSTRVFQIISFSPFLSHVIA